MPYKVPMHRPAQAPKAGRVERRPNAAARGYCDSRHRAWRKAVLARDCWECRVCKRVCGGKGEAHADHIVPVSRGGSRYDLLNGQCLCSACHGRKTEEETRSDR